MNKRAFKVNEFRSFSFYYTTFLIIFSLVPAGQHRAWAQTEGTVAITVSTTSVPLPATEGTILITAATTPVTLPEIEGTITITASTTPVTLPSTLDSITITVSATPISLPPDEQQVNVTAIATPINVFERNGLMALYNSTNGPSWTNRSNWRNMTDTDFNFPGTECTWFGIICDAEETTIERIHLANNNLVGPLPSEIGGFQDLIELDFNTNQLTGAIPPELEELENLTDLLLWNNELTGPIPLELATIPNLVNLQLHDNRLSGAVPSELGNLATLRTLTLSSNILDGTLPTQIVNLVNLTDGCSDFRWNALSTDDDDVRLFMNSKQIGGDWESTQTIAPTGLFTTDHSSESMTVNWSPVAYQADAGGYEVCFSEGTEGPYIYFGQVPDKAITSLQVTGLDFRTLHTFVTRTFTSPHAHNKNLITSEESIKGDGITVTKTMPIWLTKIMEDIEIDWSTEEDVDFYNILNTPDLNVQFTSLLEFVTPSELHQGGVLTAENRFYIVEPVTPGYVAASDPVVGNLRYCPPSIGAGFVQGSDILEECRQADEEQFNHILTHHITVMQDEVTRQMWADLKMAQPSLPDDPTDTLYGDGMDNPVQNVTWFEAVLFANLLSVQNDLVVCYYEDTAYTIPVTTVAPPVVFCNFAATGFRLLTEGEWEHACRAATTSPFSLIENQYNSTTCSSCIKGELSDLENHAVFCANDNGRSEPVITTMPNSWNLRNMHGNVREWCWDYYGPYCGAATDYTGPASGTEHVVRGGSWNDMAAECRSAARTSSLPDLADYTTGFRLCRMIHE